MFEALKCLENRVFEAPKLFSSETLFLKHYYRRQGYGLLHGFRCRIPWVVTELR